MPNANIYIYIYIYIYAKYIYICICVCIYIYILSHSQRCVVICYGFILPFPDASDVKPLFMGFIAICIYTLEK